MVQAYTRRNKLKKSVLEGWSEECPFNLTWPEALITLYSLQQYEVQCEKKDIKYAQNTFYNNIPPVLSGIRNSASRTTVMGMLQDGVCIVCGEPIGSLKGKKLDHLIPKHFGGQDNLENTLSLCRSHNSSKGTKDLIEWWVWKEWEVMDLPRNILCLYTRLMWDAVDGIHDDLPDYIRLFITQRAAALPSKEHRVALYGSTYAAMGFLGWERMYGDL